MLKTACEGYDPHKGVTDLLAGLEYLLITLGIRQAHMPRETLSAPSHRTSGAKTRAALGAPRVDDSAPGRRTHAGAETVGTFAL